MNNKSKVMSSNKKATKQGKNADVKEQRTGNTSRRSNERRNVEPTRNGVSLSVADNDVSWYSSNAILYNTVANVSYNTGLGSRTGLFKDISGTIVGNELETIPGIEVMKYAGIPGYTDSAKSSVMTAANAIYTWVRHDNSGHSNYSKEDYMMYLLAMDSAYSYLAWMRRVYGTLGLYSQFNRYAPEGILTAMGTDPSDLKLHVIDLRYYINLYASKLASYVIPGNMSYFQRHMWMSSNIFLDEPALKAGLIIYQPAGFHVYDEMSGPGRLIFQTLGSNMKFEDIVALGDDILARIMCSEDLGIMSGDTLKAYSDSGIWKVEPIDQNYMVVPAYSAEVLDQMHNTTFLPVDISSLDITQVVSTEVNGSYIVCKPSIYVPYSSPDYGISFYSKLRLFDVTVDDPSKDVTMVASRNMAFITDSEESKDGVSYHIGCVGSEIFMEYAIYSMHYTSSSPSGIAYSVLTRDRTFSCSDNTDNPMEGIGMMAVFNKAPMFYNFNFTGSNTWILDNYFADINNYAVVDREVVARLHEVALMSEFNVPIMGIYTNYSK